MNRVAGNGTGGQVVLVAWSLGKGNAANPMTGCGVQQTRGPRVEETAEVGRNHEGGTCSDGWHRQTELGSRPEGSGHERGSWWRGGREDGSEFFGTRFHTRTNLVGGGSVMGRSQRDEVASLKAREVHGGCSESNT